MPRLANRRHETFARHYAAHHVGAKAARAAGVAEGSSRIRACEWLRRPEIKARILELDRIAIKDTDIEARKVKVELARIAFADPRELFNEDGTPRHPRDWSDDVAAAVASLKVKQNRTTTPQPDGLPDVVRIETVTEVRLWDKVAAARILAIHLRLIGQDVDASLSAQRSMGERMEAARKRLEARGLRLISNATNAGTGTDPHQDPGRP